MGIPFESGSEELPEAAKACSDGADEQGWCSSEDERPVNLNVGLDSNQVFQVLSAVELGDAESLDTLLRRSSHPSLLALARHEDGDYLLHLAALYGSLECVHVLLKYGALPESRDLEGALALHDAAAGGYRAICEVLLQSDPSTINATDAEGDTPLHNAARAGAADVIQLLLERGADAHLQNADLRKPVQLAADDASKALLTSR